MYECPNCGGNLKFSIEDQLMKCDYCQTTFDPYSLKKENDADRKSTRLNSSHLVISYAVFCLKKKFF